MVKRCKDCWWNDPYEDVCEKGHRLLRKIPIKCVHFKMSKPVKYVERFTECDKCQYLSECKQEGVVLDVTTSFDKFPHYGLPSEKCRMRG